MKLMSQISKASEHLYHFIWDDFADWYVEASKIKTNPSILKYTLETILKLSHPFAPFISEAIWQSLGWSTNQMLISSDWPKTVNGSSKDAKTFDDVKKIVVEVRNLTNTFKLKQGRLTYNSSQ